MRGRVPAVFAGVGVQVRDELMMRARTLALPSCPPSPPLPFLLSPVFRMCAGGARIPAKRLERLASRSLLLRGACQLAVTTISPRHLFPPPPPSHSPCPPRAFTQAEHRGLFPDPAPALFLHPRSIPLVSRACALEGWSSLPGRLFSLLSLPPLQVHRICGAHSLLTFLSTPLLPCRATPSLAPCRALLPFVLYKCALPSSLLLPPRHFHLAACVPWLQLPPATYQGWARAVA